MPLMFGRQPRRRHPPLLTPQSGGGVEPAYVIFLAHDDASIQEADVRDPIGGHMHPIAMTVKPVRHVNEYGRAHCYRFAHRNHPFRLI
jgi:hypothetical protein